MRVTFLGTGDAGGVPVYGCDCTACQRARTDPSFRRRPCSALVEAGNTRILIDAGLSDLVERFPPGTLTAIVLTHFHPDHVQGLFHLRWGIGDEIPVYGPPDSIGCADLYKNSGLLDFRQLRKFNPLHVGELTLTPLPLIHSKVTFGYGIEDSAGQRFAYLTDTIGLPPRTESFLKRWQPDSVALDCTHPPSFMAPRNHNNLHTALALGEALKPAKIWLTHISHEMDLWLSEHLDEIPHISVAHDFQIIE